MKKLLLAAVATAFTATPALAQQTQSINLQGNVALSCTVTAGPSITNPEPIDLANTASDQSLGSLTYACNNAGGFTRTISSANSGLLKRVNGAAGENTVAYQFGHGGTNTIALANAPLSSAVITNVPGSQAYVNGQTGTARVRVGAASGPLFAGNYTDTITVTIAPNG
jgi:spore coat protein U-like protein